MHNYDALSYAGFTKQHCCNLPTTRYEDRLTATRMSNKFNPNSWIKLIQLSSRLHETRDKTNQWHAVRHQSQFLQQNKTLIWMWSFIFTWDQINEPHQPESVAQKCIKQAKSDFPLKKHASRQREMTHRGQEWGRGQCDLRCLCLQTKSGLVLTRFG